MYEMLVGENPFKITKEEELINIIKEDVTIPAYLNISSEAQNFLEICLRKNPLSRVGIKQLIEHAFFAKYPDRQAQKNKVFGLG